MVIHDVVVVDTSLAFKWFVDEADSGAARALGTQWSRQGVRIVAPILMLAETANALHRAVVDRDIEAATALDLVEHILAFGIELYGAVPLHSRAVELASELSQGAVYDCIFLALAESLDSELWTADARFHGAARGRYPRVRLLAEFDALT